MIAQGVLDAAASLLSSKAEWHTLQVGLLFGTVIAVLWRDHRDVALTLLTVATTLSIMQSGLGWSSAQAAANRPIESQPWYFYSPVVGGLLIGVTYDNWSDSE